MSETHTTYSVVPAPTVPEASISSSDVITLGEASIVSGSYFDPGTFGTTGGDFTKQQRSINHVAAGAMSRAILFPYSISSFKQSQPELFSSHWVYMQTAYGAPYFPKYDGVPVSGNENANNSSISSTTSQMQWADYGGADVRGQSFHCATTVVDLADDKFKSSPWEIQCSPFTVASKYYYGFSRGTSLSQGGLVSGNPTVGAISNSSYESGQLFDHSGAIGPTGMAPVTVGWSRFQGQSGENDSAHQGGTSIVHAAAIDEDGKVYIRVEGGWGNRNRFPRSFLVESGVFGSSPSRSDSNYRSERYDTADCESLGFVQGGSVTPDGHTYFRWPSGTASVESSYQSMALSNANSVWRTTSGYRVKLTPIF